MSCRSAFRLVRQNGNHQRWQYLRPLSSKASTCTTQLRTRNAISSSRSHSSAGPHHHGTDVINDSAAINGSFENLPLDNQVLSGTAAASLLSACPGCGALAQTIEQNEAGYYTLRRKAVKDFLDQINDDHSQGSSLVENAVFKEALAGASAEVTKKLELATGRSDDTSSRPATPLCDRCHALLHHHTGTPIFHPSVDSLHETIAESPYKYNHIYHVVDAADFPLSLVPRINKLLSLDPLRSKNRRAKQGGFRHGKKMDMSFIITRSDLLAPKKEQVDHLMPYLTDVLRNAIGRTAQDVRLGNVRCVSGKREWWTKELKADVWNRGGGQWLVGKVNVGKSKLFESIFPKGKAEDINFDRLRSKVRLPVPSVADVEGNHPGTQIAPSTTDLILDDKGTLLPPARVETPYPTMPTVSHLPGTTASPIRIPFGSGKGELIDLPGLDRPSLAPYVLPEHQSCLMLKARPVSKQHRIRPGQSLLLGGGLLRITPSTPNIDILAYPFVPAEMKAHVTSTAKATSSNTPETAFKTPDSSTSSPIDRLHLPNIPTVTAAGVITNLKSAGIFELAWDVTKPRAGPLTASDAVGLKTERLPFQVLSVDLLIEGVGWVELVAQVRRAPRDGNDGEDANINKQKVEVEVLSPNGTCVGSRQPMGAWLLGAPMRKAKPQRRLPLKAHAP